MIIGAALVVVTGGKTFLNWLLMMLSGERFLIALKTSLIISPVGEFSFVIAGTGLAVGRFRIMGQEIEDVRLWMPKPVAAQAPGE